jgi:hypothetical protein
MDDDMADDLEELRKRVAAARDRLNSDVDFAQKVELRLNDLARIVEGSLARQSAELDAAQARITVLEADLTRALARAEQAAGDAARADRLAKENGELRSMMMTLLEVIEGRQKSSLASVMQQLEENVTALVITEALPLGAEWDAPLETSAAPDQGANPSGQEVELELETERAPTAPDAAPAPADPAAMEDLSEIALYDASNEVIEPGKN